MTPGVMPIAVTLSTEKHRRLDLILDFEGAAETGKLEGLEGLEAEWKVAVRTGTLPC